MHLNGFKTPAMKYGLFPLKANKTDTVGKKPNTASVLLFVSETIMLTMYHPNGSQSSSGLATMPPNLNMPQSRAIEYRVSAALPPMAKPCEMLLSWPKPKAKVQLAIQMQINAIQT